MSQEQINEMSRALGRIEGKLDGYLDRTTKLEKAQERQWWVSYVVTPIIIAIGHVSRAMGARI